MGAHVLVFMGVAAIVIIVPGPDTAVVTKNVLLHGRRAGLGTSLGVSAGLAVWTLAAAVGVASLVRASEIAFTVLKLIGAAYLIWLGVQSWRAAGRGPDDGDGRSRGGSVGGGELSGGRRGGSGMEERRGGSGMGPLGRGSGSGALGRGSGMGPLGGFRQGLFSDLANPKIGIFFTSLLPQFVNPGHAVLLPFLALGSVFVLMTMAWLAVYCAVAARAAEALQRPRVKAVMDRLTGIVLIAIGLRVAAEHR